MKTSNIIRIIVSILLIILLIIIMVSYLLGNKNFIFIKTDSVQLKYEEYNKEDVQEIEFKSSEIDVKVIENDTDKIKIVIMGKDENDSNNFILNLENGVLKLDKQIHYGFKIEFFDFAREEILLYLPKEFDKNINFNSTSGNITFEMDVLSNIIISNNSGDIYIDDCNNIDIETISGNVKVGIANNVDIKTVSGDIFIDDSKDIKIHSTSGDINLGSVKNLDIDTVSGDITIDSVYVTNDSNIKTISGDIKILKKNSIYIDVKSKSGDINVTDNDRMASIVLSIETTSGDVLVK